jgi:hypothetical protein
MGHVHRSASASNIPTQGDDPYEVRAPRASRAARRQPAAVEQSMPKGARRQPSRASLAQLVKFLPVRMPLLQLVAC